MQYKYIGAQDQLTGLRNRLRDLEAEHYVNSIHIKECEAIGDESSKNDFLTKNQWLEKQYDKLSAELTKLEDESEQLEEE